MEVQGGVTVETTEVTKIDHLSRVYPLLAACNLQDF